MNSFPVHTVQSAPAPSRSLLQDLQKEVGIVPNLAATMAESTPLLESFITIRKVLRGSGLTTPERETVSLVVSFENECTYCMAAHSTFAKTAGASDAAVTALRSGQTHPRLAALVTFTRHLLANRGHASDQAKSAFLQAGFTPAQMLEVIGVIAFTTIANYAHNVTRCDVDMPFEAQRWEAAARRPA
jgi:uncharacterized peroxidase-related enzyme